MQTRERSADATAPTDNARVTKLTADLVRAYLSHNAVMPKDVPVVIAQVHHALVQASHASEPEAAPGPQKPAVPRHRSVTRNYIVCLEDGLRFRSLKRHLRVAHHLSPEEYRAKWRLRADYPMAAPAFSEVRSALTRELLHGGQTVSKKAP